VLRDKKVVGVFCAFHCAASFQYTGLGQTLPAGETTPVFGPSRLIDFELETFITTDANVMGK
jgi:hypothetical protein